MIRVIISLIVGAILWVGMARQQLPESLPKHRFEPPEVIPTIDVVYPFNSIAFGTVVLQVRLSKSGEIEDVKVVRDIPSLTVEAKRAVMRWKFKPATVDGRPEKSAVPVAFTFVHPSLLPRFGGQILTC